MFCAHSVFALVLSRDAKTCDCAPHGLWVQVRDAADASGTQVLDLAGVVGATKLLPVLLAFLDVELPRALPASRSASMPSLAGAASAAHSSTYAESRQVGAQRCIRRKGDAPLMRTNHRTAPRRASSRSWRGSRSRSRLTRTACTPCSCALLLA